MRHAGEDCFHRGARRVLVLGVAMFAFVAPRIATAQEIEVTSVDGVKLTGEVAQFAPDLQIHSKEGDITLDWSEVMMLRRAGAATSRPSKEPSDGHWFALSDGSLFRAKVVESTGDELTLELRDGQRAQIARNAIKSITSAAISDRARELFEANVAEAADSGEDVAVVSRGSDALPLRGTIRAIEPERVVFAWKGRDLSAPWDKLAALGVGRPLARGAGGLSYTTRGEVFAGRIVAGDDDAIVLRSSAYDQLRLPWSELDRIELQSERVRYLSDAQTARYEFEPFLEKRWLAARDRTLTGEPIRLGGKTYEKGLTLHSQSLISYAVGGGYRNFAATIGIADEVGQIGAATVRIIGDNKVLWEAEDVRGGEPPKQALVDISGVAELTLMVEFGAELDIGDHVCFANARVIR